LKAVGVFSNPSTTVSLNLIFPSCNNKIGTFN
jgi:hypothetical protein